MTWNSARLQAIRQQFPSLQRLHEQQEAVYLDGPAGSQVPRRVAERIAEVMIDHQANRHGRFETSRQVDAIIDDAHQAASEGLPIQVRADGGRPLRVHTRKRHDRRLQPRVLETRQGCLQLRAQPTPLSQDASQKAGGVGYGFR